MKKILYLINYIKNIILIIYIGYLILILNNNNIENKINNY